MDDESEAIGDEEAQARQDAMDEIGNDLDAIERTPLVYPAGVAPKAGAVVSIDSKGAVLVHRGLLHEEDAKALRAQQGDADGNEGAGEVDPKEADEREESPSQMGSEKVVRATYRCLAGRAS